MRGSLFFPAVALLTTGLQAQEARPAAAAGPTVAGVVRGVDGVPVPEVEVGIVKGDRLQQFVITAADGRFLLTGLAPSVVPLRFRRLGYAMQSIEVDPRAPASSDLQIVLKEVASELPDVTIAGNNELRLHEFYEHREQRGSFGTFYEQSEIRQRGAINPSDLFRTIPGIDIRTGSGGNTMRIRGCQPMVWVDGQRVPGAELDEVIHPSEIAAIEFYPSNAGAPPKYMERGNRLCGMVLVWTRAQ